MEDDQSEDGTAVGAPDPAISTFMGASPVMGGGGMGLVLGALMAAVAIALVARRHLRRRTPRRTDR